MLQIYQAPIHSFIIRSILQTAELKMWAPTI